MRRLPRAQRREVAASPDRRSGLSGQYLRIVRGDDVGLRIAPVAVGVVLAIPAGEDQADERQAIRAILGNDEGRARCRDYASRMDSDAAVTRACELIEGLSP